MAAPINGVEERLDALLNVNRGILKTLEELLRIQRDLGSPKPQPEPDMISLKERSKGKGK